MASESAVTARTHILAAALGYFVVSLAMRISITHWPGAGLRQPLGALRLGFVDLLLISGITILALLLVRAARHRRSGILAIQLIFLLVSLLLSALACVNVRAFELLGTPLTYQWMLFAGDFQSRTARDAIRAAADSSFWQMTAAMCLAYLVTYAVSVLTLRKISRGPYGRYVLPTVATSVAAILILSVSPWQVQEEYRKYLTNPFLELISSAAPSGTENLLSQRDGIQPERLPPQRNASQNLPADLRPGQVRNVIIVVLESVGSKYVVSRGTEGQADWTPNLSRYEPWTLKFTNAYAHAGRSTKTLYSLISGQPPTFSYMADTETFSRARFVGLPAVLKDRGVRTGMFMTDLDYLKIRAFLDRRGFDQMVNANDLTCEGPVNDECTVSALTRWISGGSSPFFAVLWTNDTHYPYALAKSPRAGRFSSDPEQNKFLAALRSSDAAVGRLLDWLRTRGLLDSTLVVVLGDHGDAFGEHGTRLHSGTIFEEEVKIPMLLISSSLRGRSYGTLVATSDVPQTILHVLKFPAERSWEGRSFFEPTRARRLFLFGWQSPSVGFREGDKKYIYDIGSDKTSLFDLATDPGEKTNIADADTEKYIRRLAAGWVQMQESKLPEEGRSLGD